MSSHFVSVLCEFCLLPSPSCVLCNAYKTVYGNNFLKYRFEKYSRTKAEFLRSTTVTPIRQSYARRSISPSHIPPRARARVAEATSSDEERALLRTAPHVANKPVIEDIRSTPVPVMSAPLDEFSELASSDDEEVPSRSLPLPSSKALPSQIQSTPNPIFSGPIPDFAAPTPILSTSRASSRMSESAKIRQRVKQLMEKNNSVLVRHSFCSSIAQI